MTSTATQTQTYNTADIGKVIDCVAADLDMICQLTGLLSRDTARQYASDVKRMAQAGYLLEANIVLKNSAGIEIRAAKYVVNTNAANLTAQRPGNNDWPRTPGGALTVVVKYSSMWLLTPEAAKVDFRRTLSTTWSDVNMDLSFPGLTQSLDRNYVSNGWGVTKSNYS
jgi:hypothetical protein